MPPPDPPAKRDWRVGSAHPVNHAVTSPLADQATHHVGSDKSAAARSRRNVCFSAMDIPYSIKASLLSSKIWIVSGRPLCGPGYRQGVYHNTDLPIQLRSSWSVPSAVIDFHVGDSESLAAWVRITEDIGRDAAEFQILFSLPANPLPEPLFCLVATMAAKRMAGQLAVELQVGLVARPWPFPSV